MGDVCASVSVGDSKHPRGFDLRRSSTLAALSVEETQDFDLRPKGDPPSELAGEHLAKTEQERQTVRSTTNKLVWRRTSQVPAVF